ncbi:MAG TPA: TIGR03435 family protein [Bryobacteraceae bacterium]|jgi:uncharacterized protein (TIGR03435 family)
MRSLAIAAALLFICASQPFAQSADSAPSSVVSIKPSKDGFAPPGFRITRGRFVANNVTVRFLVAIAYGLQSFQVSGGPRWVDAEQFDVEAKLDAPDPPAHQESAMIRGLLADRFKLVLHKDESPIPAYALVFAGNAPNRTLSADQSAGASPTGQVHVGPGALVAKGIRLELVASLLGTRLGRPVIDRTNLHERYDVDLRWTPDIGELPGASADATPQGDASGPSIFTAIREQLGLKLESTKGPSGFLVIDHVERPPAN